MRHRVPLILLILDGWGYEAKTQHNAIANASTPQWDEWWMSRPHTLIQASGNHVGLPESQMGNSEVGHMHIGAGRVIYQDFTRINQAITSGDYFQNPAFLQVIDSMKATNKTLHIMGLLSKGGVHSHEEHLFAFLALCHQQKFHNVCLHLFLDGRDTPPQSALANIEALNQQLEKYPVGRVCSISGRYFAMDRDNRWDRISPVYRLLTEAESPNHFDNAETAIATYYNENISDEFIPPTRIGAKHPINDGDSIFFFNFRSDRARQLTETFTNKNFSEFERIAQPALSHFVSMTHYSSKLPTECAFPPITMQNTVGEVIAKHGLRQLRIAETEKYAHVTYFFNGGSEKIFPGEERTLIPSPTVATYNLQPEMSAPQLTKALVDAINNDAYDIIICNYANADMVGHSGDFQATVRAVECLDHCMRDIWRALSVKGGNLLITADHGNAEMMFDEESGQTHTAHTCQPVPLLYVGEGWHFKPDITGSLIDIAPTMLALLGIESPKEMTGLSLLVENHANKD